MSTHDTVGNTPHIDRQVRLGPDGSKGLDELHGQHVLPHVIPGFHDAGPDVCDDGRDLNALPSIAITGSSNHTHH